jgi:hypothetical protein
MKKIPYGIANYEKIKENNNYYYVDKTKYIEILENLGYSISLLPPSETIRQITLHISLLEHYYDINRKDQFEMLFGDTYIGKHPTPLKNSFPILKLNFSGIITSKSLTDIERSFDLKIRDNIHSFYKKY